MGRPGNKASHKFCCFLLRDTQDDMKKLAALDGTRPTLGRVTVGLILLSYCSTEQVSIISEQARDTPGRTTVALHGGTKTLHYSTWNS